MSEIRVTEWTIPGSDDQPIYGNTHWPNDDAIGVLICCHGFKGYKDYGFFPLLCQCAAKAGLIALRFNFSHSGMTNHIDRFERPDLFELDRWSLQVQDLQTVFDSAAPALPHVLFGHSRGGVTSTLFAGTCRNNQLSGLITAAAPDNACKMDDLVRDQLRAEGRLLSPSSRTGQDLYVGLGWLEEIEQDPDAYDSLKAAATINCPMLILHGDEDDTISLESAELLHNAAQPHSDLVVIKGANHVFNAPNPLPSDTTIESLMPQTSELIQRSVDFALRCCDAPGN